MVGFADFMAARTNPKVAERRPAVPVSRFLRRTFPAFWAKRQPEPSGMSSLQEYARLSCIGQAAFAKWKVTG
jgi:hypothetical protein